MDPSLRGVKSIPAGLGVGATIGALNGFGVAVLRIPGMIWALGINAAVLGCRIRFTGASLPLARPPLQ